MLASIKQQADSIVDKFRPYSGIGDAYDFRATHAAIKHVEGILNELTRGITLNDRKEIYKVLLTELKSRI